MSGSMSVKMNMSTSMSDLQPKAFGVRRGARHKFGRTFQAFRAQLVSSVGAGQVWGS